MIDFFAFIRTVEDACPYRFAGFLRLVPSYTGVGDADPYESLVSRI